MLLRAVVVAVKLRRFIDLESKRRNIVLWIKRVTLHLRRNESRTENANLKNG